MVQRSKRSRCKPRLLFNTTSKHVNLEDFDDYVLLRKSTAQRLKRKMRDIKKKLNNGGRLTYSDFCSINSYKGWVKWCNGYNLYKTYIKPLEPYCEEYYKEMIVSESI